MGKARRASALGQARDKYRVFEIIGKILVGWLLADFLSGIVHWWMDGADPKLPLVGPRVIVANQEHHLDPLDFTRATPLKRNAALFIFVAGLSSLWLILWGASWLWFATTIASAMSGEIHVWAHTSKTPGVLTRTLWGTGLIQSPAVHARHHRKPHDSSFCTITNWFNPLLDGLGFWHLLDRLAGRK